MTKDRARKYFKKPITLITSDGKTLNDDLLEWCVHFGGAFAEAESTASKEAVRYALATFRALDRYTFEDSDHALLIAEAVKKLEAVCGIPER